MEDSYDQTIRYKTYKPKKVDDVNIIDINYTNYNNLIVNKFNISDLKKGLKQYKLKNTGKKSELLDRLYNFLKSSSHVIKLQCLFRGFIIRKMFKLRGSVVFTNREQCVNKEDFLTMDPLNTISPIDFFSFEDDDNHIYGFHIMSIYNLIKNTTSEQILNPYTRKELNINIIPNIYRIIKICKTMKLPIDIIIQNDNCELSVKRKIEMRTIDIFQIINSLGNYSEPKWFLNLSKNELYKFTRELFDIWNYRANLTEQVKCNICPPRGIICTQFEKNSIFMENNIFSLQTKLLNILERLITSGIDQDFKVLGAYYVLAAITLVSPEASAIMPWLYQSVYY
jgi:hypothetical protein